MENKTFIKTLDCINGDFTSICYNERREVKSEYFLTTTDGGAGIKWENTKLKDRTTESF